MKRLAYKITSVLVFDDVRFEQSGKEILIGVYDNMLVPEFSFSTPLMCFRVTLRLESLPTEELTTAFRLISPTGEELFATRGVAQTEDLSFSVGVRRAPMTFPVAGTYRLFFGLNREAEEVYQFEVRLQDGAPA